jgi:diguanylate cyclase (GGDEF)-like protein/PAS domain S-box-containing protein
MSAADEQRPPLHEATLRLLSLLATSRLEEDLLQEGIEALVTILQTRYGAIGLVDDTGKLRQFVYTGIGPEEAARIGRLPEGRGLLGVTTPLRLGDMSRDPRSVGFPPHHPPMKSLLSVPFSHEGHNYGRVYLSEKLDGSDFSREDEQLLSHFASVFAMMLAYQRAQTERERSAKILREISHALSAITGDAFFRVLVLNLTRALGVAYALIGEVTDAGCRAVRTVAVGLDGKLADNFVYKLDGTPCENVVDKEVCFYTHGVQQLFPDDRMLAEMGIESYVGSPLFDSRGNPLGILVLLDRKPLADPEHAQSILKICAARASAELERRHQELALQASEANLRALAENAGEGILVNMDGRHVFANRRLAEMLGYRDAGELLNTTVRDVVHPDEFERVSGRFRRRVAGEKEPSQYETVFVTKQDRAVPVEISATITAWQGQPAGLIFVRDITERKKSEQTLRDSEERFRQLAENIQEVFWMTDPSKNRMLYVSPAYEKIWGRRCADLYENPTAWLEAIHPDDRERVRQAALTKQISGAYNEEYRIVRPDGTKRWIQDRAFPILDDTGKPYRITGIAEDITERKLAEDQTRQLSSAVEQTADSVIITDAHGVIQYINSACQSVTGYSPEETIGNNPRLLKSGQHPPEFYQRLWETITRGEVFRERFINRRKDGSLYHEEKTITPLKDARGEITHFVSTGKDITQRVEAEKTLRESNELLERIFDSTHFCLAYLDRDFNFIRVNRAYGKTCGYPPEYFPGKNHFRLYPHRENEAIFRRVVQTGEPFTTIAKPFEFPDHPEWGVTYWDWTLHPLKDDAGNVEAVLFVLLDVTERRRTEEQLNALAYYDALTGLPNRQQLYDHLQWAMKEAAGRERLVAILFLDLDRFKNINDTLGHDVGDALLKEVAARLRTSVRPGDIISRLGGDEFTIVLANVAHLDDATRVAQKLLDHFLPPFRIAGRDLFVSPSIGITLYPFDGNNAEDLIKNADIAMYHAKELGRNNFQFYTPELNVRAARRLELETGLRRALERDEFVLHFQPLVKMDSGRIAGMEALLRWQHPEYGLIPPMEFIPLAEETGLIVPIGEWVLRAACAQIKAWHDAGFPGMHVAVNLSSVQLQQKNFVDVVKRALRDTGLEPRYLDLELTETLLMQDMETAEAILKELHVLGVLFSLDDFGTGYSSLSYLKRFPIDFLKIDRSFVRDIVHDRYGAGIVRAIIVMAHTLGIKVIAEGVETAGHFRFLRQQGCDISQGYYCSRPLATESFTELLRDWRHVQSGKCSLVKTARKSRKKQVRPKRPARK